MKKVLMTLFVLLVLLVNINVKAYEGKINPNWEKYINSTLEEQAKYNVIPSKYIYEFVSSNKLEKLYKFNSDNELKSYSFSVHDLTNNLELPSKFDLSNINGKNYVNAITKNQGTLGLCVVFGVFGSIESNLLYKGLDNSNNIISMCKNDENTKYCRIKDDLELNEKYINGQSEENTSFSERNIDYVSSKAADSGTVLNPSGKYTIITEKYNPYFNNRTLGNAFSVELIEKLFSYGVAPKRSEGIWKEYDSKTDTKSLSEIFDSVSQDYIVTDYYSYFMRPQNQTSATEWENTLKKDIMEYGAREVSIDISPTSYYAGSCLYHDNNKNINFVRDDGNCGVYNYGGHSMQVIGWDDDYNYNYCKLSTSTSDEYTQESCENEGYKWISGKGAWILKNSWGTSNLYVYLAYDSQLAMFSGARKIESVDFDNSYNPAISLIDKIKTNDESTLLYKYYKSNKDETLSRINILLGTYKNEFTIFVSNDGNNFIEVATDTNDYPGLRSYKIGNYVLNEESFYIKISSNNRIILNDTPTVLTLNNENITIDTYIKDAYINKNITNKIEVRTKTFNISSGSKLDYKIFDENNNDLTNNFVIENNYVVTNNNIVNINFNSDIKNGKYTLKTIYNDAISDCVFNIIENDAIKLKVKEPIFVSDKTIKIDYNVLLENTNNFRWTISNENIATIKNGILNIKKGGKVTISLIVNTPDGDVSSSLDLVIFDEKITTPQEFIQILNSSTKSYYIMNDLDFSGVNYDNVYAKYHRFEGILDGGFHTIRNVTRNGSVSNGVALISILSGTVKNLIIEDSSFENTNGAAGGITANLMNGGSIENVYVKNAKISGTTKVGGIAGGINGSEIVSNCAFEGEVSSISSSGNAYAGGLVGQTFYGKIINSYNMGSVYAKGGSSSKTYVAGIVNGGFSNAITNSYNIGQIIVDENNISASYAGIDTSINSKITNSYYLQNSNYNVVNDGAKTNEELLDKNTYENWNFDNIWYMSDTYPILQIFPTDATDIKLDLFSNIINTNSEYEYDLIIEPYGNKEQVVIENLTPELITIKNNKIVTGKNEGKAQIKLSIGDKSFIKEYDLVDLIKYSYNKEFTNKDIDIKFDIKYYQNDLSNGYLELIYNDNVIKVDTNTKNVDVKVSNNETINYKLKVCIDACKEIYSDVIKITNIDKERPIIKSSYKNKELLINITDEISGIKATEFLYGISDSDVNVPKEMKEFNNNKIISNITMNYKIKYLWIKNIYDEAGNGLCDSEYCVYDLDIKRNNYSVSYYDEDRKTLIKKEEYLEDEKIEIIEYEKEDSNYYYELSSWEGYQEDLVITKDIELYAKYNKTSKQIKSDKYKVENNYIKNIMLSNIYNKYSYKDFISNISQKEEFLMYENNNIISPEYIKTGMIYKNKYKEYKIVLTGDVTGDGLVKMNDIMMIANHLIDNNTLKNEYFYAADLTNDDKVKMNDLMKLANIMINGGNV